MTKKALLKKARELEIKGARRMNKAELEAAIAKAEQPAPVTAPKETPEERQARIEARVQAALDAHADEANEHGIAHGAKFVTANGIEHFVTGCDVDENGEVTAVRTVSTLNGRQYEVTVRDLVKKIAKEAVAV